MAKPYPSDDDLKTIENWPIEDLHGLMAFIKELWEYDAFQYKGDDIYVLATSGWSGNEDIISAMMDNQIFWLMYWEESSRGGRHVFAPCTMAAMDAIDKLRETNQLRITAEDKHDSNLT